MHDTWIELIMPQGAVRIRSLSSHPQGLGGATSGYTALDAPLTLQGPDYSQARMYGVLLNLFGPPVVASDQFEYVLDIEYRATGASVQISASAADHGPLLHTYASGPEALAGVELIRDLLDTYPPAEFEQQFDNDEYGCTTLYGCTDGQCWHRTRTSADDEVVYGP